MTVVLTFSPAPTHAIVAAGKHQGDAMKPLGFVGALFALLATSVAALAQNYPSRPITMIVGFPPGGPTDTLARIVADGMKSSLGQPIVIEDVTGAGGTIGTADVVHANPDGYTIGIGNWTSHVGSPAIYQGFGADCISGRRAAVDPRQERLAAA
jgi:tripartite-type tricarboxylate transporter receptor subunit TctC